MSLLARCPTLVAICAVLVAMVTMLVWWLPILILGGAGLLYLLAARRAERRGAHLSAAGAHAASAREGELHAQEWERTLDRDYGNLPGFGDVRGYFRLNGWCTRVVSGNVGSETDDPRELRWWAARLIAIGGVFGTLGRASDLGAWAPALPILFVLGAASLLIANTGPRPRVEAE